MLCDPAEEDGTVKVLLHAPTELAEVAVVNCSTVESHLDTRFTGAEAGTCHSYRTPWCPAGFVQGNNWGRNK